MANIVFPDIAAEYKPLLEEVEKILAEAGLDEEEMRRGAAGGGNAINQSRNRRWTIVSAIHSFVYVEVLSIYIIAGMP